MSTLALAAGGVLWVFATIVLIEAPILGAVLILIPVVLQSLYGSLPGINVGPVTLFIPDFIFISLFLVMFIRSLITRTEFGKISLWLIYGFVGLLAFVRGMADFGVVQSGVGYRTYFYAFVCVMYFASFPLTKASLNRYGNLWISIGLLFCVVAIWRWTSLAMDPSSSVISTREAAFSSIRVLNVRETFFILEAGLVTFFIWMQKNRQGYTYLLSIVFIPIMLILSHRTLWVVFVIAVLLLKPNTGKKSDVLMPILSLVFVGVLIFSVSTGVGSDVLGLSFTSAFSEATDSESSTFLWRYQGWQALFAGQNFLSPGFLLLGNGTGAGFLRFIDNIEIVVSPHNFYIQNFLVLGLPGVLAWTAFYVFCIKRLRKLSSVAISTTFNFSLLSILLISQMIYSIPYVIEYEQYILLGIAVRLAFYSDIRSPETAVDLPDSRANKVYHIKNV